MKPYMLDEEVVIIDSILKPEWRVLEWGCGGSTIRWKDRVKEWITIEHDREWAREVGGPVRLREEYLEYVEVPYEFGRFDLFIIDGVWRAETLEVASHFGELALEHDAIRTSPSAHWPRSIMLWPGKIEGNGAKHKGLRLYFR